MVNNIVSTNKGKDLLEVVLGPDSTFSFCYNRCGINLKLKKYQKNTSYCLQRIYIGMFEISVCSACFLSASLFYLYMNF